MPVELPRLPPALSNPGREVFEIPAGAGADAIQQIINLAATHCGERPVVHLPAGIYILNHTITVPANCDLQLIGDGAKTALRWSAPGGQPVLLLQGPSRATLRDFSVYGSFNSVQAEGIVIENGDQAGSRIYLEQVSITRAAQAGLVVDGLEWAKVELRAFYHSENELGVQVRGAGQTFGSEKRGGRVAIFGGGSANNRLSYDLRDGGDLLVRDMWYEAGATNYPQFMVCTNSGRFTLHGANVAPGSAQTAIPVITASNFVGQLTFLGTTTLFPNSRLSVFGSGQGTDILLLGTVNSNEPDFAAPQARSSLQQSFKILPDGSYNLMEDRGPVDPDFMRAMLRQTRVARPLPLMALPAGETDVRLHRVFVEGGRIGIHLKK
jgi:hypothetical protein